MQQMRCVVLIVLIINKLAWFVPYIDQQGAPLIQSLMWEFLLHKVLPQ